MLTTCGASDCCTQVNKKLLPLLQAKMKITRAGRPAGEKNKAAADKRAKSYLEDAQHKRQTDEDRDGGCESSAHVKCNSAQNLESDD